MTAYEDHFDQYAFEDCEYCGKLMLDCECEEDQMNRRDQEPSITIPIIQLQILDDLTGQNIGGLYINPDKICSLIPQKFVAATNGQTYHGTRVNTVDGKSFMCPHNIVEVLSMIGH